MSGGTHDPQSPSTTPLRLRDSHPLRSPRSSGVRLCLVGHARSLPVPPRARSTPTPHRRQPVPQCGFGLLPVRSPLLRESSLFLGVREMFQFPRCPPATLGVRYHHGRVAPFGDRRITSSQHFPCAFRRVGASFIGLSHLGIHHVPFFGSCHPPITVQAVVFVVRAVRPCRRHTPGHLPAEGSLLQLLKVSPHRPAVEPRGFEPRTSAVQGRRSPD